MSNAAFPYSSFIEVDKNFLPCISENAMNDRDSDLWQSFFPHPAFVDLLHHVVDIALHKEHENNNIWLKGAYGSGKTHAILTLYSLLTLDYENKVKPYLEKFADELDNDLKDKLTVLRKKHTVVVAHLYGSSDIKLVTDLVTVVESAIINAIREQITLSDNIEAFLIEQKLFSFLDGSDLQKEHLAALTKKLPEAGLSEFPDAQVLMDYLKSLSVDPSQAELLATYRPKLVQLIRKAGLNINYTTIDSLKTWLEEITQQYGIKEVLLIWDEMTEFFNKKERSLTAFQQLLEMSDDLSVLVVTHPNAQIGNLVIDRFKTIINLTIPQDLSFDLLASALNENTATAPADWRQSLAENCEDASSALAQIMEQNYEVKTKDQGALLEKYKKLLPLHPYAAMALIMFAKQIGSNVRSQFSFIKAEDMVRSVNDDPHQIKTFSDFLRLYAFSEDDWDGNYLTIDMLWSFFDDIVSIKEERVAKNFNFYRDKASLIQGNTNLERVFKAVLILNTMFEESNNSAANVKPTLSILENCFDGTDLHDNLAQLLDQLINQELLFKEHKGKDGSTIIYRPLLSVEDQEVLQDNIEKVESESFSNVVETEFADKESLSSILENNLATMKGGERFQYCTVFKESDLLSCQKNSSKYQIPVAYCFAKNEADADELEQALQNFYEENEDTPLIAVSLCYTPFDEFGKNNAKRYSESRGQYLYFNNKDPARAETEKNNYQQVLREWSDRVCREDIIVYSKENKNSDFVQGLSGVTARLQQILRERLPYCAESLFPTLTQTVFANNISTSNMKVALGVGLIPLSKAKAQDALKKVDQTYVQAVGVDLHKQPLLETITIGSLKNIDKIADFMEIAQIPVTADKNHVYWKTVKGNVFSEMKLKLEKFLSKKQVAIESTEVVEFTRKHFGFTKNNISAFLLTFFMRDYLLKNYEYTNNGSTHNTTKPLDGSSLMEFIKDGFDAVFSGKKARCLLAPVTDEQKNFVEYSKKIFDLKYTDDNAAAVLDAIRTKANSYGCPLAVLGYASSLHENPSADSVRKLLELYSTLISKKERGGEEAHLDSACWREIVHIFYENMELIDEMTTFLSAQDQESNDALHNFIRLTEVQDGLTVEDLAQQAHVPNYLDDVNQMLRLTEDSSWLWDTSDIQGVLTSIGLRYQILMLSNTLLLQLEYPVQASSFEQAVQCWREFIEKAQVLSCDSIVEDREQKEKDPEFCDFLSCLKGIVKREQGLFISKESLSRFKQVLLSQQDLTLKLFEQKQIEAFKAIFVRELEKSVLQNQQDKFFKERVGLGSETFLQSAESFRQEVQAQVNEYKREKNIESFIDIWKVGVETEDTPHEWSQQHQIPLIWCFTKDEDIQKAKNAFSFLNHEDSGGDLDEATEFLVNALDALKSFMRSEELQRAALKRHMLNPDFLNDDLIDFNEFKKRLCERKEFAHCTPDQWADSEEFPGIAKSICDLYYRDHLSTTVRNEVGARDPKTLQEVLVKAAAINSQLGIELYKLLCK